MYGAGYSCLPPDPLPPGPRVTNPAAPLLRLLLRSFNVALAALALLLIGLALWLDERYRHGGGEAPAPAPEGRTPDGTPGVRGAAAALLAAAPLAAWLQAAVATVPWFIYLLGGTGAYCLATALCGLAGVRRDRRRHLGAHIAMLALLLLAGAAATLLLLTDNGWRRRIPDDPSGAWREAQAWVAANGRLARIAAVAALGVQLAALAAACWLQAIYQAAYDAWLDDREEASERARQVLARTVVQTYAGGSGSSWSARLRSKYGVDASALEAASNEARQAAALQDDRP